MDHGTSKNRQWLIEVVDSSPKGVENQDQPYTDRVKQETKQSKLNNLNKCFLNILSFKNCSINYNAYANMAVLRTSNEETKVNHEVSQTRHSDS